MPTKPIIHCGGFPRRKSLILYNGLDLGGKIPDGFSRNAIIAEPLAVISKANPAYKLITKYEPI
tara:strand:+ start:630 stop:821 length:192 start_codon:yes stop_codon:yes gene_type:complete